MSALLRYNVQWIPPRCDLCKRCSWSTDDGKNCTHPEVMAPVIEARDVGGNCGTEARFIRIPGVV